MVIQQKGIKRLFVAAVFATLCMSMSACGLFDNKPSGGESVMSITGPTSEDISSAACDDLKSVRQAQNPGEYVSQRFSLTYPEDVMHLEEQEVSEEGDTFLISLTKKGEDIGSIPRLDIISVDVTGLTEDAVKELSESDAGQAFESFAASLLTAYYHIEFDEQGNVVRSTAPTIEFRDTIVQVEGEKKFCETRASISETDDLPAMQAAIRLQGGAEDGLVSIIFAQDTLDEESKAVLDSVIASIQFS